LRIEPGSDGDSPAVGQDQDEEIRAGSRIFDGGRRGGDGKELDDRVGGRDGPGAIEVLAEGQE
jgi:hypothetical protein